MAPKAKSKAKAKASPKVKAKAAIKANVKAKAKAAQKAPKKAAKAKAEVVEEVEEAKVEVPKKARRATKPEGEAKEVKTRGLINKVLNMAGEKPFDEVMSEHKHKLHSIDATIAEASALEEAQTAQAAAAKKELDQASADVRTLEDEEKDLLNQQTELKSSKTKAAALLEEKKKSTPGGAANPQPR